MKLTSNIGRGLVAVAVAGSCGYLSAATVTTSAVSHTDAFVQGAAATADVATGAIRVSLAAAYAAGNALVLTLQNGAQFSSAAANTASVVNCQSGASNDMILAYQAGGASGSTAVTYIVQSLSGTPTTASLTCSFGSRAVLARSLPTSGSAGVQFTAFTSSAPGATAIDNATAATATIATARSQFAFGSVSGVSGTIDVTNNRLAFTAAPTAKPVNPAINALIGANTADAIQFRFNAVSLGASASATPQTFEVAIAGDFNFADDTGGQCSATDLSAGNGRVGVEYSLNAGAVTATGASLDISTNCQTLTVKLSPTIMATAATNADPAVSNYVTVSLQRATATAGQQFVAGSYTGQVPSFGTYGTSAANGGQATTWSAGTLLSNGMVVDVPYMPFGNAGANSVGHVLVWHNRSNQSSVLSLSAYKNGSTTPCATSTSLVTIDANSSKNISTEVRDYVAACWPADYTATSGPRVSLRFEANLPASTNELYSAFTIGTDRALVPNSSTGRGAPRSNQ